MRPELCAMEYIPVLEATNDTSSGGKFTVIMPAGEDRMSMTE